MKVAIELRKHTKAVADAVPQGAMALKQGSGLQPAGVVIRQVEEVLKRVGFQHFPQFEQLLGPG